MTAINRSVLFVGAYPAPAALDRYVSGDLALRLQSLGWKIQVTSRRSGRLARVVEIVFDIWRARRQYGVACLDVFSGPAFRWAEAAFALLRWLGKPCVLTLHGGGLPEFSRQHPKRVRNLLCNAAAVTCPSAYLQAEMQHFRPDLVLLPNALDLSRYTYQERSAPPRHLVWLRAFHEIYNPELAVRVLAKIREKLPDIHLTMMGPDKGDGSLQKTMDTARRLGADGAVAFLGAVPKQDVPKQLALGDIFINTTNFDNTPVSVLEAMACGLPVISTDVGGIPYLLKDRETALLVPPANVEIMADAVFRLLQEPGLGLRLGREGRKLVEGFDWGVVLPRWERLLEGLVFRS